jgi:hypothetical protein
MARNENPPFERGSTAYNGGVINTAAPGGLVGLEWEGKVWEFEDLQYNTPNLVGAKPARSNRSVQCMCVRNVSGVNILPGQLCNLQMAGTDGRYYLGRVDGLAYIGAQRAYPADEWLPAAGVPNNDMFWVVVAGPASILTPLDAGADNVFTVGERVVALTAVTSQATSAGRIAPQVLTGATAPLAQQIQGQIGWALSAATTANTNQLLLVEVGELGF